MSSLRRSTSASSLTSLQRTVDFPPFSSRREVKSESPSPPPLVLSAPLRLRRKPEDVPSNYVSLPSTPVSRSPQTTRGRYLSDVSISGSAPFSLWDYLREELLATDFDSHQEMKWERVSNFLNVPFAIEKVSIRVISVISAQRAYKKIDHRIRNYSML